MNSNEKNNKIIDDSFKQLDNLLTILIKDSNVSKSGMIKDTYNDVQKVKVKSNNNVEPGKSK